MFTNSIYLIYMYKLDLALNGWYVIKPNQTKPNQTKTFSRFFFLSFLNVLFPLRSFFLSFFPFFIRSESSFYHNHQICPSSFVSRGFSFTLFLFFFFLKWILLFFLLFIWGVSAVTVTAKFIIPSWWDQFFFYVFSFLHSFFLSFLLTFFLSYFSFFLSFFLLMLDLVLL